MSFLDRLSNPQGSAPYPARFVSRVFAPLLEKIPIDPAWAELVRSIAERGPLVHVVRNVSTVDYLALDFISRKLGLPRVGFANELRPWVAPGTELSLSLVFGGL